MVTVRGSTVAAWLSLALIAPVGPAESSIGAPTGSPAPNSPAPARTEAPRPTIHSSDGVHGPALRDQVLAGARLGADVDPDPPPVPVGWQVAPGLEYAEWTRLEPQGPVQVFVLTASLDQPGLTLDQVSGPAVQNRAPLSRWIAADGAVAGVNADFFDIGDTGAPLGVGFDRQRQLLHAPRQGWNTSFVIDQQGTPRVTQANLVARAVRRGRPAITVTNHNSPTVAPDGIGRYTPAWGRTVGRRVVQGAQRVRQVVVRGGVVRSNRRTLASGTLIRGEMLVGRGSGARVLRGLRVGRRVRVQSGLSPAVRVAVSGSVQLLRGGQLTTGDNTQLHPRTAIGIDRDGRRLHLVVVDGRSELSRGQTLRQLAELLRSLGDEDAINLDGGGSSTLIARDTAGVVAVRNRPSDGRERAVPNGLAFRYTPPPG